MITALRSGTPGEIDGLLRCGMRLDAVDDYGRSLLHLAAAAGETQIARHLLQRGAHIMRNPFDGRTALHAACEGGHTETVALLLNAGASPVVRDSRGLTPADCAAARGHHDAIRAVLASSCGKPC